MADINRCRICGFCYDGYYPWGPDNKTPTYDICECCGGEFGFDDYTLDDIRSYRKKWVSEGAKFYVSLHRPEHWNFEEQLKNVPKDYL
jgi:hypothetical protein